MKRLAIAIVVVAAVLNPSGALAAGSGQVRGQVAVFPATVAFTVSPLSTKTGQSAQAQATITNRGAATLSNVQVDLRIDSTGLKTAKTGQLINQIKPGKSASVSWLVCGRTVGSYVLLVHVTIGALAIDSTARILTVSRGTKGCP